MEPVSQDDAEIDYQSYFRSGRTLPPYVHPGEKPADAPAKPVPVQSTPTPHPSADRKRTAGRFLAMNAFADYSARLVNTTAQAVWWVLFRDTKSNGTVTVAQGQIAERIGVCRQTVTRSLKQLETAGLIEVLKQGGFQKGSSTYRIIPAPEQYPNQAKRQVTPAHTSQAHW